MIAMVCLVLSSCMPQCSALVDDYAGYTSMLLLKLSCGTAVRRRLA